MNDGIIHSIVSMVTTGGQPPAPLKPEFAPVVRDRNHVTTGGQPPAPLKRRYAPGKLKRGESQPGGNPRLY